MLAKWLKRTYTASPYIISAIVTVLYLMLALLRHRQFRTYGYDLGIYDQTVWLYSRFIYPFVTIEYKFALLNHFSPSLALFAPVYWIWSDPKALLILQALLIGASAIPVIKLADKLNLPVYLKSVLTLSYLTFFGYQYSVNFDVHSLVFGTVLVPWLLLALENRKTRWAIALYLVIIGMKESFPIMMFSIGLVYFLRGRRKLGIYIMASSAAYIVILMKVLIPLMELLTGEHYRFTSSNPASPFEYVTRLWNTPAKIEVWKLSSLWFALIPFFAPVIAIPAIGDVLFYLVLGENHPETQQIYMHYRSSLAPLLIWAALYACVNLKKVFRIPFIAQAVLLLLSWAYFQYSYHLPLNSLAKPDWYRKPDYVDNNLKIISQVPKEVPLTVQDSLVPWLSQRKEIHILWSFKENNGYRKFDIYNSPCGSEYCYWLTFHRKTQYVVVDAHPGQDARTLLMENETKLKEGLSNMEKAGVITLVASQGDAMLWKVNRKTFLEYDEIDQTERKKKAQTK